MWLSPHKPEVCFTKTKNNTKTSTWEHGMEKHWTRSTLKSTQPPSQRVMDFFFFFDSLPSSRLGVNKAHTERLKKSFFPRAVKALIEDWAGLANCTLHPTRQIHWTFTWAIICLIFIIIFLFIIALLNSNYLVIVNLVPPISCFLFISFILYAALKKTAIKEFCWTKLHNGNKEPI